MCSKGEQETEVLKGVRKGWSVLRGAYAHGVGNQGEGSNRRIKTRG